MRKTLESLFHGNIRPSENQIIPNSDLLRAVDKAARCEKRLTEHLSEAEKVILTELVRAQHDIDSITAREHFIHHREHDHLRDKAGESYRTKSWRDICIKIMYTII